MPEADNPTPLTVDVRAPRGLPAPFAERLPDRLEFETLISDTSAALFTAPADQLGRVVETALASVRVFFNADRCALLSASADQQVWTVRFASYAAGLPPVPPDLNLAPLFPWTARTLTVERRPIRVARIADLPPEAEIERDAWIQMSIRSALNIPIETVGVVRHAILLNIVRHEYEWPDVFVTRLRVLGELLVGAVERQAMLASLRDSEESVELAAESAEAGLWSFYYETGTFWLTERARKIFGYSPDEVVTVERVEASIHPEDLELVRRAMQVSGEQHPPADVEYRIRRADGHLRWIASRGRAHFNAAGGLSVFTGVSIDITERKRAEEALRTSETRLASGAALAGLAFYELDFTAGTTYIDDRFRALCGVSQEEENRALSFWMEHLHPDDRPRILEQREQLHSGNFDTIDVEYRFLHPFDGEKWIHHLARISRRDSRGRATRAYGVLRDITTRRRAEEALRESLAEIERLKDRLQAEGEYLKAEIRLAHDHSPITGQSAGLTKVLRMVEQVAPTNSTVLVCGETGTGKELIAAAIHRLSPRQNQVMVKVNCAAIPSGLLESELFGREKGAYTGALSRQVGRFEFADHSTLFLDEVGELSMDMQAKLLRVLESGEFERLGSPRTIKVNVRLIAATNRDLAEAVRQGKFRDDLYYRLSVFPIRIPPLRDRSDDIPMLVWAFLQEFSSRMGKKITRVPRKTMDSLISYRWPGNVRELRNVIEHGAIISPGDTLIIPALDEGDPRPASRQTLADSEREIILRVLERSGWRIKGPKGAAAELGLNPATLYSRMKKLGIQPRRQQDNTS